VSSGCADEPVAVGQATPELTTTQEPASGVVGATFKDKATVGGLNGAKPAGTISWKLYANNNCEGEPVASDGPVTVTKIGDYGTRSEERRVGDGSCYWVASYSGDENNKAESRRWGDENVECRKATQEL